MNPELPLLRIGLPMVIATGVIQVLAQLTLAQAVELLPLPPQSRYPKFFMLTHSVVAVTDHRLVGALESAVGMMMFGWSTALLVSVVQRTDRHPRP